MANNQEIVVPHVAVHFDPSKVRQADIDKLKPYLQKSVAFCLSSRECLADGASVGSIHTRPEEVYVYQHQTHPTDANPSPVEIVVQAGQTKGRDPDKVRNMIANEVRVSQILSPIVLGEGASCVWVRFCEENSFGFIPQYYAD